MIIKTKVCKIGNSRGIVLPKEALQAVHRELLAPEEQAVLITRGLAAGEIEEKSYAAWLKDQSAPRPS